MNNEHWKHQTEKKDKQLTQISKKIGNKDLIKTKNKTKKNKKQKAKQNEKNTKKPSKNNNKT